MRTTGIKTIGTMQVSYLTLDELQPGQITTEGIVISKSTWAHTYTTPAGEFEVNSSEQTIAVYAQIENTMLVTLIETVNERKAAQ